MLFPADTTASILTSGLLGEQYVGLEAGADTAMLKGGDRVLITQSAVVLENSSASSCSTAPPTRPPSRSAGSPEKNNAKRLPLLPCRPGRGRDCRPRSLGGCATTANPIDDPLEGYNRAMFGFNEQLDKVVIKPPRRWPRPVLPHPCAPVSATCSATSAIPGSRSTTCCRTLGSPRACATPCASRSIHLGPARPARHRRRGGPAGHDEDLGQTLGPLGRGRGRLHRAAFFGPRTVRDAVPARRLHGPTSLSASITWRRATRCWARGCARPLHAARCRPHGSRRRRSTATPSCATSTSNNAVTRSAMAARNACMKISTNSRPHRSVATSMRPRPPRSEPRHAGIGAPPATTGRRVARQSVQ